VGPAPPSVSAITPKPGIMILYRPRPPYGTEWTFQFRRFQFPRSAAAVAPGGAAEEVSVPRVVVAPRAKTSGSWTKETRPNVTKPLGTLNKITRTMKDAAVEAAHELGRVPVKLWGKQLNGDLNGLKGYFKFLAVKHPKSFAVILSRIMPVHVATSSGKLPKYLTEEQMRSELRAAGLPEDLIKFMALIV
jgi:hypothetical protein